MNNLINASNVYGFEINCWDIIFRIITYPFLIIFIYIPLITICTSYLNKRNRFYNYVYLRVKSKRIIIITNIIITTSIAIISTSIVYLTSIILGILNLGLEFGWSEVVRSFAKDVKILTELYPLNFTSDLSPINSVIISYVLIVIAVLITFYLRDLLFEVFTNNKISSIFLSIAIFINIALSAIPTVLMSSTFVQLLNYGSYMIWMHKFGEDISYEITLTHSIIVGVLCIITLLIFRLKLSKRMVIENEH
ncbi:MAG: hypothetical protein ACRC7N_08800 [Clostridium sp.]